VDIKKLFLWVGATGMLLVGSLALGAIYWIELQAKEFRRKQTEKARLQKLKNQGFDVITEDDVAKANQELIDQHEREEEEKQSTGIPAD